MKKFMVADLVKDLRENSILRAMEIFDLNRANAEIFVDDFPNESTWADVEEVAESLGVDITDVEDDDVENYMEMGRENKGSLESSIGPIQWIYDNKLKAYIVYITLDGMKCGSGEVMYKLTPEQMKEWKSQDSMGEYYNDNVRSKVEEDPDVSCGCCENLCEPQQIATFKDKYSSIS